jgi:acyl-CoA thioesterase-1
MSRSVLSLIVLFLCVGLARAAEPMPRIVFLGDSLTAGYGVDPDSAYSALLKTRLAEADLHYEIVNACVSGDTTAGGLRRLKWIMRKPADVLVICLGGNDGLRGLDLEASRGNLEAIIDAARKANPHIRILLAGMQIHPNMGAEYVEAFQAMYPAIAKAKAVPLLPFILEGVAGDPDLNIADGIHPNEAGHRIMADTVWAALKPLLLDGETAPEDTE